ncbi:MAG: hypothetical protein KDK70_30975 [Myxococcales bacterium]|nr:hypothetical protein [Myxococcales bacterium]
MRYGGWRWEAALCGAALGLACGGSSVFLCQSDGDCQTREGPGQCQPTGYCSFPDDSCDSGQRYGDHAGGALATTCVDPADATGTTDGPPPDDASSSAPGSTGGNTSPLDTGPLDTGPDGPDLGAEDTGPSPGVVCQHDDFDADRLDPGWCVETVPAIAFSSQLAQLRVDLLPQLWNGAEQYGDLHNCDPVPLLDAVATVEVVHAPQLYPFTEAFLELGNDEGRIGLGVYEGELEVFTFGSRGYVQVAAAPYDPNAQQYWRVRGSKAGLSAESSPDGVSWEPLHTMPFPTEFAQGTVRLGVWSGDMPLQPDYASFEWLELCWVP